MGRSVHRTVRAQPAQDTILSNGVSWPVPNFTGIQFADDTQILVTVRKVK